MTKRSAESASLHATQQQKKKCRSGSDAELELEAEHAQHVPALFTALLVERRRKRPRCEQHVKPAAPGRRPSNATDGANEETGDLCASGKFLRGSDSCTRMRVMESKESASGSKLEARTKVARPDDTEDQLSAFNSFQFWRTPLPALDLSLLESPSTPELGEVTSLKDATEAMET